MKTLRKFCLAALGGAIAFSAHAQTPRFDDDFEYANSFGDITFPGLAGNDGDWEIWDAARQASMGLSTADPDSTPNKSIFMTPATTNDSAGFLVHKLFTTEVNPGPIPTNEAPVVFSFSFFDHMEEDTETGALLTGRIFGVIRPVGANNFAAIGLFNTVDSGTFDVTRYQARVLGGPGPGWIQLATERSLGWREFKVVIHHDSVDFWVDGQLDQNGANIPRNPGAVIEQITIGSTLSTLSGAMFDNVRVVVDPGAARPILISQQPAPLTVAVGDEAVFSVVATGTGTLGYQWEKDGVDLFDGSGISGVETDTLTISSVDFDDGAIYRVRLTDGPETQHSAGALLTVQPFLFTQQPQTAVGIEGDPEPAVFTVVVHGEGPFTYQWQKDGVDLEEGAPFSGVETDTLTVTDFTVADEGAYTVVVSNSHGTRTSNVAALSIGPLETGVRFGHFEDVTTVPTGNAQWLFQHPRFSGSTDQMLALTPSSSAVRDDFPAGMWGARALRLQFAFLEEDLSIADRTNPWARVSTTPSGATNFLKSPIIGFDRFLRFDIYTNQDIYIAIGVRETHAPGLTPPSQEYGENGGGAGSIEWVGGEIDPENPSPIGRPPRSRLIEAGQWTAVYFDLANDPVKPFAAGTTLNGELDGDRGVLEHLAITPVRDAEGDVPLGTFTIWLDNFEVTEVGPSLPPGPDAAPTVNITRGAGADIELIIVGEPSTTYVVEVSTDLVSWSVLGTAPTDSEGIGDFIDGDAVNNARRFYRVSEE